MGRLLSVLSVRKLRLVLSGTLQRFTSQVFLRNFPLESWFLDYLSCGADPTLTNDSLVVRGWVQLKPEFNEAQNQVQIVCHLQRTFELRCPLDVVDQGAPKTSRTEGASTDNQLRYGFSLTVPPGLSKFELAIEVNGQRWSLQKVNVKPVKLAQGPIKVLKGNDGWLFLDNDTNFSVDQFAGRIGLTSRGLQNWQTYSQAFSKGFDGLRCSPVLLVAPMKEKVMEEYHPETAAAQPVIQPIIDLFRPEQVVYPEGELKEYLGDAAFFKTDTHWTQKGAGLAAKLVAQKLGLSESGIDELLADDCYKPSKHVGDLGGKLEPPVSAPAELLTSFRHRKWVAYDNGLPNFGRLIVIQYASALEDATCLIFGSSSSYQMFNYLCRFYTRIIFVHSAGNIDPSLISAVQPHYLIAQTNERFMIRPPVTDYCLKKTIIEKQKSLDAAGLERQAKLRKVDDIKLLEELGLSPWHLQDLQAS